MKIIFYVEVWTNLVSNSSLSNLLPAAVPFVSSWLCLVMQPARVPFDPAVLVQYAQVSYLVYDLMLIFCCIN